jgi:glycosyltransferase involved in cell wall biosynthesis
MHSVALVWGGSDWSSEPIGPHLADLLEHGWDAHLLCDGDDRLLADELGEVPPDALRARVHPPPRPLRSRAPRARLVGGAIRAGIRAPGSAVREVGGAPDSRARYLRAVLLGLKPGVLRLCSPGGIDRYGGIAAAVGARTLVSVTGDGAWSLVLDQPERLRESLVLADAVHIESERLADHLRGTGMADDRLFVVPPGSDATLLELGARSVPGGDALRILSVGSITWAQGYEHALQAVALLADRGIPCAYRIVGRGDFADAIAFARYQLGLERLVQIVEPGSPATLRDSMSWADVLVSAAVVERSPRALLDGQAAGLPVVTTQTPPHAEQGVLLVPKRDPEALAETLAVLARDPDQCRRLGEAGRRVARSAMTKEEQLARLRELYGQVLGLETV